MFRIIRTTQARFPSDEEYVPRLPRPAGPSDDLLEVIGLSRLTFR
jgi:hypothetical protein